ncbi:uncharacterized protein EV420DRAFT_1478724 [Desarmillaria tabescens]|uniref:Uncharacterized protein n=1 Tax=Armillaria tabescens TaxID=1929756 RepID=A0AA39N6Z2_ARMTA|nr:uncharacterized protein EV420DRAFT_1478724 [Desarmillaria tabescens]KAK0460202.1 hypothetical protein EV420DRAFT_1478724 [Desarmillaria tabescens]
MEGQGSRGFKCKIYFMEEDEHEEASNKKDRKWVKGRRGIEDKTMLNKTTAEAQERKRQRNPMKMMNVDENFPWIAQGESDGNSHVGQSKKGIQDSELQGLAQGGLFAGCPSVKYIKGPPLASFQLGHECVLHNQANAGDLETKWRREYGMLYHVGGCLGQDVLVNTTFILNLFIGQGLSTVVICTQRHLAHSDETHHHQHKILNLAFSLMQL